jgi:hypothetical protein
MSSEITLAAKQKVDYPKPTLKFQLNGSSCGYFAIKREEDGKTTESLHTKNVQDLMKVVYESAINKLIEKQKGSSEYKFDPAKIKIYEYKNDCIISDEENEVSLKEVEIEETEDIKKIFDNYSKQLQTKTALSVYKFAAILMTEKNTALASGISSPQPSATVVNIQTTSSSAFEKQKAPKDVIDSKEGAANLGRVEDLSDTDSKEPRALNASPLSIVDTKDTRISESGDNFLVELKKDYTINIIKDTLKKAFIKSSTKKAFSDNENRVLERFIEMFKKKKEYKNFFCFSEMVKRTTLASMVPEIADPIEWEDAFINHQYKKANPA